MKPIKIKYIRKQPTTFFQPWGAPPSVLGSAVLLPDTKGIRLLLSKGFTKQPGAPSPLLKGVRSLGKGRGSGAIQVATVFTRAGIKPKQAFPNFRRFCKERKRKELRGEKLEYSPLRGGPGTQSQGPTTENDGNCSANLLLASPPPSLRLALWDL